MENLISDFMGLAVEAVEKESVPVSSSGRPRIKSSMSSVSFVRSAVFMKCSGL